MIIQATGYKNGNIHDIVEFKFCKIKAGNLCKLHTDVLENLIKDSEKVTITRIKD